MSQILLCSNTHGALYDVGEILLNTGSFEVLDFEKGFDNAIAALRLATPDLLIINLSDFESNHYVSLLSLTSELKGMPILVYGTTLEYTTFNAMYMGSSLPQLEKPAEGDKILRTVARALDMSDAEADELISMIEPKGNTDKKHILIVDDNAILLRSLKTLLQQDYRVTLAKTGEGAIKAINRDVPDIVILDFDMPDMNGYEVLKHIREDENTKNLKVIFLTGVSDRKNIAEVMKFDPSGYLLKPVNHKTLFAAIETTLKE